MKRKNVSSEIAMLSRYLSFKFPVGLYRNICLAIFFRVCVVVNVTFCT